MFTSAAPLAIDAAILIAAAFAWAKGAVPERIGGLINLAAAVLAICVHLAVGAHALSTFLLAIDGLLALGFLALALRYASLWLGGALLCQGVQFSLHAFYLVSNRRFDFSYALVNNLNSWGIVACILAGTWASWRRNSLAQAA